MQTSSFMTGPMRGLLSRESEVRVLPGPPFLGKDRSLSGELTNSCGCLSQPVLVIIVSFFVLALAALAAPLPFASFVSS
jgi:hypothetical protein